MKVLYGLMFVFSTCLPSLSAAQTLVSFNTKDLPKAKGLDITVKHPSDWRIDESNRPNIVGKFVKKTPDTYNSMIVIIANASPSDIREFQNSSLDELRKMNTFDNTVAIKVTKVKLEDQDAYITDVRSTEERMNVKAKTRMQFLQMIYKDKLISMNCGVVKNDKFSEADLENSFKMIEKQCFNFFNSLVLVQRYQR